MLKSNTLCGYHITVMSQCKIEMLVTGHSMNMWKKYVHVLVTLVQIEDEIIC